jgi:hypothetical protein
MGAGKKLRVLAGRGIAAVGAAALASACGHASVNSPLVLEQAQGPATPTMTPSSVPVLGNLTLGTFPSTADGRRALTVCEQWAGLRGEYVSRVQADTAYELEQWFSSAVWGPAFSANSRLRVDPAYGDINTAFGLATSGQAASIATARLLDKACAAAD